MFRKLDRPVQQRLRTFLREQIAVSDNPRRIGHALTGRFSGLWRYRVGNYRIVCRLEDERLVVLVLAIGGIDLSRDTLPPQ